MSMRSILIAITAAASLSGIAASHAQDGCSNRGQLDQSYCDADNDLVADVPVDPAKQKDPATLVFAYTPIEDPAVYQSLMKPFVDYLAQCTAKKVVYFPVQSNSAQIEAMRSGRLHIAAFASGPTGFAVNLAPRVLFPGEDLEAEEDYKPIMSGGHDKSMSGVASGDYDMAAVSSDTFERMAQRGVIKVAEESGTPYNRAAYEAEQRREAAAAAKKKAMPGVADAPTKQAP